jgi:hypothetical protein
MATSKTTTKIHGSVTDSNGKPIFNAHVYVQNKEFGAYTATNGQYNFDISPGDFTLICEYSSGYSSGEPVQDPIDITIDKNTKELNVNFKAPVKELKRPIRAGGIIAENFDSHDKKISTTKQSEPIAVRLSPGAGINSLDKELWEKIEKRNIEFKDYKELMDSILNCNLEDLYNGSREKVIDKNHLPFNRTEAYSLLKFATEKYVEKKLGLSVPNATPYFPDSRLPYYSLILERISEFLDNEEPPTERECEDLMVVKDQPILLELIWSYWHEEGMLVQTMNAIARRFQNVRNNERDPLANLELDPLRPLNNILWGYIQDTQHRLTISRRTYEYDHHYGIRLLGKAIPEFMPADSRSKFIQSFHNLLYRASLYFKEADDMTINADAFPLLNALRETHLILAEGSHNQFGDLPTVARIEMLMEQWILARPEIREFLGGRIMVPYDETWMDRVDTMKTLQGWPDTSISYYHDLAKYGEQIILGVRYGNWSRVIDRDSARNWADRWRDAIQRYLHSYHSVTGVDLTLESYNQSKDEKYIMPAFLIQQKVQKEKALKRG